MDLKSKTQVIATLEALKVDTESKINELKRDIRNLGAVNVNAIEEYKEISERYNTMKTQQSDLVEAAATLQKIIDELDNSLHFKLSRAIIALFNNELNENAQLIATLKEIGSKR